MYCQSREKFPFHQIVDAGKKKLFMSPKPFLLVCHIAAKVRVSKNCSTHFLSFIQFSRVISVINYENLFANLINEGTRKSDR